MSALELHDRSISFRPIFVKWTGSVNAALMLSQLVYWSIRTKDPEQWIYKTAAQWEEETRLTQREQVRARKLLRKSGLVEEKVKRQPNGNTAVHFRITKQFDKLARSGIDQKCIPECTKGNFQSSLRSRDSYIDYKHSAAERTACEDLIIKCAIHLDKFLRTKRNLNNQQEPRAKWEKQLRWILRDKIEGNFQRLKRVARGYCTQSYEHKPVINNAYQFKDKFFQIEDWLNRYEPPPVPDKVHVTYV